MRFKLLLSMVSLIAPGSVLAEVVISSSLSGLEPSALTVEEPLQGQYSPAPTKPPPRKPLTSAERDDIRKKMQTLAPLDAGGKAVAHLWLAQDLLQRAKRTPEESQQLRRHLDHVLQQNPKAVQARLMLVNLHMRTNDLESAAKELRRIVEVAPRFRLQLASVLRRLKREDEARAELQVASKHFQPLAEGKDLQKQVPARLLWARAELATKNYNAVARILKDGMKAKSDIRYRAAAADMYLARMRDALGSEKPDVRQAFLSLNKALSAAPRYPAVLRQVAAFAAEYPNANKTLRKQLEKVVASEKTDSVLARVVLGNLCVAQEDWFTAATSFEQAWGMAPKNAMAANNLAWSLGQLSPPQLDRALRVSEKAIELAALHPRIANEANITRGSLLLKARRWSEAIHCFESVPPAAFERPDVSEGLAMAKAALQKADN